MSAYAARVSTLAVYTGILLGNILERGIHMYPKTNENAKRNALLNIIEESEHSNEFERLGNCVFLKLENGNNIKVTCGDTKLVCRTINRTGGEVDVTDLPFSAYFAPVRCSEGAPWWIPCIDGADWRFSNYPHCLPKPEDFQTIAEAVDDYILMFS